MCPETSEGNIWGRGWNWKETGMLCRYGEIVLYNFSETEKILRRVRPGGLSVLHECALVGKKDVSLNSHIKTSLSHFFLFIYIWVKSIFIWTAWNKLCFLAGKVQLNPCVLWIGTTALKSRKLVDLHQLLHIN